MKKITGVYCKPTTISSTYAAKGAFTKGRGAEGRKMQKNFAIAKISEGRGEKEVSGLFVRGKCGVGALGAGENARSAPPANFLGEERKGGRREGGVEAATATATAIFSNLRSAATTMI